MRWNRDFMNKKEKNVSGIMIYLLLGLLAVLFTGCRESDGNDAGYYETDGEKSMFYFDLNKTYMPDGICYLDQGYIHFIDGIIGEDVVMCSKPNCLHKKNGDDTITCDGYVGIFTKLSFIYDNQLYYIRMNGSLDDELKNYLDLDMYRADVNGQNRQLYFSFENAENIISANLSGDYLVFSYACDDEYDKDSTNADVYDFKKLERVNAGICLVDLRKNTSTKIEELSEYSAMYRDLYIVNDKLYYTRCYSSKLIDYLNPDIEEMLREVEENFKTELICYDLTTGDKKILSNERIFRCRSTGQALFAYGRNDLKKYVNGEQAKISGNVELLQQMTSVQHYIYEDALIAFIDGKVISLNLVSGEADSFANGKYDNLGMAGIDVITDEYVCYHKESRNSFVTYLINKDSFFDGKLEDSVALNWD